MGNCLNWIFGRGVSAASGLSWTVPKEWACLSRDNLIKKIKATLPKKMDEASTSVYNKFLSILAKKTQIGWRHRLITTNWDYLLQKAIDEQSFTELPCWLADGWVYHLNGTIENLPDNSQRSPFLLESDPSGQRIVSFEANDAYNKIIWDDSFVVVGMSFECQIDKGLLGALRKVEDHMPVGESWWLIVNSSQKSLERVAQNIQIALPRSKIKTVQSSFESWLDSEMPELEDNGVMIP
jgi:hypothetical protein